MRDEGGRRASLQNKSAGVTLPIASSRHFQKMFQVGLANVHCPGTGVVGAIASDDCSDRH